MRTLDDIRMWAAGHVEKQGLPPEFGRADREEWRQRYKVSKQK